jgi:hypothetical protein
MAPGELVRTASGGNQREGAHDVVEVGRLPGTSVADRRAEVGITPVAEYELRISQGES